MRTVESFALQNVVETRLLPVWVVGCISTRAVIVGEQTHVQTEGQGGKELNGPPVLGTGDKWREGEREQERDRE